MRRRPPRDDSERLAHVLEDIEADHARSFFETGLYRRDHRIGRLLNWLRAEMGTADASTILGLPDSELRKARRMGPGTIALWRSYLAWDRVCERYARTREG